MKVKIKSLLSLLKEFQESGKSPEDFLKWTFPSPLELEQWESQEDGQKDEWISVEEKVDIFTYIKHLPITDEQKETLTEFIKQLPMAFEADKDEWFETLGTEPPQYSRIFVKDKNGSIYTGGYYQENSKICINLPSGHIECMDLEENFTHWKLHSLHPATITQTS